MPNRVVKAHTPLGEEQLLFRSMHGTEGLSQLFEFEVDLLSPNTSIDMKAVLGKPLALEIQTAGAPRFLNGQVVRFSMIGREGGTSRYTIYRATVRPWLWYLTRSSDNKIFQNKTVVEILEEVFGDYNFAFEKKLSASYRQWEHCVQYNETDFAFVSRLMELEGIYYYFKHEKNQHTLVLADDVGAHAPVPDYETINYFAADRELTEDMEVIDHWEVVEEIRSGGYVIDDFDFSKPKADLSNVRSQPLSNDHADYEMYEWLGDYTDPGQGEHYARVRLEEAQSMAQRSSGHATVRGLAPGYRFTMQNSPRGDDNQEYLTVAVSYALREGGYATGAADGSYGFSFVVQPASVPFRPARTTPMPRTSGPQTATVVGPAGEEIWTDQYGRVKVQFHWDRYGQRNENSSRFVRVSHVIAGDGFGAVFTPRIGQEVVVDFISGRPDRPIIVGRVYNADQMPPFSLPGEASKSGFVTRSTPGGSPATANSLVFEDKMGSEFVALHAERELNVSVEADETHDTGGSRTTVIEGPDILTDNTLRDTTVNGPDTLLVNGPQTVTINGPETFTVNGIETTTINGPRFDTVTGGEVNTVLVQRTTTVAGPDTLTVNGGPRTENIHGAQTTTVDNHYKETSGSKEVIVKGVETYTVAAGSTRTVTGTEQIEATDQLNLFSQGSTEIRATNDININAKKVTIKGTDEIVQDTPKLTRLGASFFDFRSSVYAFQWFSGSTSAVAMFNNGVTMSNALVKIDYCALNLKNIPIKMEFCDYLSYWTGLAMEGAGLKVEW